MTGPIKPDVCLTEPSDSQQPSSRQPSSRQRFCPHWTYRHWKNHRKLQWFCAIAAAAALAAAALIFAWNKGAFLPGWIVWKEASVKLPDNPKLPTSISLKHRQLTVEQNGTMVWKSPDSVLVQDFLWCDINHDNADELILLCWRIGRYGNARPYWIKKDECTWSQHIYIYQWLDGKIHPLWMASDIGMDAVSFEFSETDRLCITETSGRKTSWDWVSWGLTLLREISPASQEQ